jgi:sulfur relay (sulfurtransferase) DsrC/TusE family protein
MFFVIRHTYEYWLTKSKLPLVKHIFQDVGSNVGVQEHKIQYIHKIFGRNSDSF